MKLVVAIALVAACTPTPAPHHPDARDEAALRAQATAWDRAIVAKDRPAIEANLAPGFLQIDGDGELAEAKAFVDGLVDPRLTIAPYTVDDLAVHLVGDETALLTGTTKMTGSYDGKPFTSHYRYIDHYVRQGGRWRVVAVQITRIPN